MPRFDIFDVDKAKLRREKFTKLSFGVVIGLSGIDGTFSVIPMDLIDLLHKILKRTLDLLLLFLRRKFFSFTHTALSPFFKTRTVVLCIQHTVVFGGE